MVATGAMVLKIGDHSSVAAFRSLVFLTGRRNLGRPSDNTLIFYQRKRPGLRRLPGQKQPRLKRSNAKRRSRKDEPKKR